MDTISRENNSTLPVAGVIVGALGLLIGGYALMSVSKVKSTLTDDQPKIDQIEGLTAQVAAAQSAATAARQAVDGQRAGIQKAFDDVGNTLIEIKTEIGKIEEAQKAAPAAHGKGAKGAKAAPEEVVAGPGEYVVKSGDTGAKIARANGCTVSELKAVNPSVNWNKLHLGQKIKLPEKKQPAA